MSSVNGVHEKTSLVFPWYVYLFAGYAATALIPWFLLCRQLNERGRRRTAIGLFACNLIIFGVFVAISWFSHLRWDLLLLFFFAVNILWSMLAWVGQRFWIGRAPQRYYLADWHDWLVPFAMALLIAAGLSVIHGLAQVVGGAGNGAYGGDPGGTRVFLWSLFQFTPKYLLYGALVGIWWAGEGKDFSLTHVISYLGGLLFGVACFALLAALLFFLLFHGEGNSQVFSWNLLPVSGHKWALRLNTFSNAEMITLAVIPLFIGVAPGFRNFWARSFAVFPAVALLLISMSFYVPETWKMYQNQIIYDMFDADNTVRSHGFSRLERLLDRYPDHAAKNMLELCRADYLYEEGNIVQAHHLYSRIAGNNTLQAHFAPGNLARAALDTSMAKEQRVEVQLPLISYTRYMTNNWMVLLRIARYYRGSLSEEEFLSSLKEVSEKEESISLPVMPTLAELDDEARLLGFSTLILPADRAAARRLLGKGYPVILPIKNRFALVYGMEGERNYTLSSNYSEIPLLLRRGTGEDVARDFALHGKKEETRKQSVRVDLFSRYPIPGTFWGSPAQRDIAPFMAVVFPPEKLNDLAAALGMDASILQRESTAQLTALIALRTLNAGDPAQSVAWAQKSSALIDSPLPLQIAYLARLYRDVGSAQSAAALPLSRYLPGLQQMDDQLEQVLSGPYMEEAARQFDEDLHAGRLPWSVRQQYRNYLGRSEEQDRELLMSLLRQDLASDPLAVSDWLLLANLYEWQDDRHGMAAALESALQANRIAGALSSYLKGRTLTSLAFQQVQLGEFEKAEKTLAEIKSEKVTRIADYYYCRAAVYEWRGKNSKAERLYKKALSLRKYVPEYHLGYGRFLLRTEGDRSAAERSLRWAMQIDVKGLVRAEAAKLLAGMR